MGAFIQTVAMLAVGGFLLYTVYRTARRRAEQSPESRTWMIVRSAGGVAIAVIAILWLPGRVPDTPGSPAALVMFTLIWLLGGMMVIMGSASLLGAWLAKPGIGTDETDMTDFSPPS